MATKLKASPQVDPEMITEVTPEVASGPVIEYVGEGAELIKFNINPKATKYVVNANGMILETM